jgi:hypothetical protein
VKNPGKRKGDEIIRHNDEKSPEVGEGTQNPAGLLAHVSDLALLRIRSGQVRQLKEFQPPAPMILTDLLFVRRGLRKELSSLLF